ncbi:hypothetical protein IX307_000370 [Bacteroides pyogenes]|uniref:Uncharacterized protein n=2 Tax=Bacteroides pyogenes TaxID=310300 RepID=W4PF74_9BACE|nr:hypothetical protein [Bacteroides pyogenes]GAE14649.1 hypothetical protein JCM6292_814 [Bacteroides pyogenes JCM 6292]MBR8719192.1 hypothetical protein [Bacteroides pyogenes]MBR8724012.1 hypothetical protein [Bacteroides pyogenes]MBR8737561.1 hypothetical protein [Bacteroides pyogenes]MBR8753136.1 hypothetical protein [Bacteroides pyogenes]
MKRQLLTDIELDVQELKCLADSFSKTPTTVFRELMARNVLQMRGRLDELLKELNADCGEVASDTKESVAAYVADNPLSVSCELEAETAQMVKEGEALNRNSVLGDSILPAVDLRRSISLNDSFRFSREIFGGDNELMNRVVEQISAMNSYHAAVAFLSSKAKLEEGEENEAMNDFLELLKKYFNQPA